MSPHQFPSPRPGSSARRRPWWYRPTTALLLGLATVLTLTAPAMAGADRAYAVEIGPEDRYVALGDSFTAGPLIPEQYGDPPLCLRSRSNYPNLVAEAYGITDFHDVSCSAAKTEHMTEAQQLPLGMRNDPQFDALTPDTTLVTVGIGGNDAGFGDIVLTCLTMSVQDPEGEPCREHFSGEGADELAERVAQAGENVADTLAGIRERSPDATVALVGYLQLLPESTGCFPLVPIARGDVGYLDGVQTHLNETLEKQAADAGVIFVDVFERGHDMCQSEADKWVEGIFPTRPAAPVHPNDEGMAHTAARIIEALGPPADMPLP